MKRWQKRSREAQVGGRDKTHRPNLLGAVCAALAVFMLATLLMTPARAVIISLDAFMDGPQANAGAGTGSPGTGTAAVTLDSATNLLSWNISWSGLSGTPFAMHFHGPALPNQNAGILVTTGIVGPPVIGNEIITAQQSTDILAGLWYINLHTTKFPGGEIRGQVGLVPEPSTLAILAFGLAGLGFVTRRRRTGIDKIKHAA